MPVDGRTMQPDRILHGGASVALAETLGSVGGSMCVDRERFQIVGVGDQCEPPAARDERPRHRPREPDPPRPAHAGVEHRDPRRPQAPGLRLATHHRGHRAPAAVNARGAILRAMRAVLSMRLPLALDGDSPPAARPARCTCPTKASSRRSRSARPAHAARLARARRAEAENERRRRQSRQSRRVADRMAKPRKLWLVDGSSYLYRAFFALPPLTTLDGRADRRPARRAQHAEQAAEGGGSRNSIADRDGRARPHLPRRAVRAIQGASAADAGRPARAGRTRCSRRSPRSACRCCASPASRPTTSSARSPSARRATGSRSSSRPATRTWPSSSTTGSRWSTRCSTRSSTARASRRSST